ncbi:hypothetical protein OE88DRAFT_1647690 [Heliocybe sulcata]|uniref:Uncharacterized protein n=1 Tax=Heliocybe sulcata TaxID=5364 RepID=A0A5C3MRW3_9AGAM|nr:hypothetical protein OE88DRAFT_1647690 [Heliocybe sulcata]
MLLVMAMLLAQWLDLVVIMFLHRIPYPAAILLTGIKPTAPQFLGLTALFFKYWLPLYCIQHWTSLHLLQRGVEVTQPDSYWPGSYFLDSEDTPTKRSTKPLVLDGCKAQGDDGYDNIWRDGSSVLVKSTHLVMRTQREQIQDCLCDAIKTHTQGHWGTVRNSKTRRDLNTINYTGGAQGWT